MLAPQLVTFHPWTQLGSVSFYEISVQCEDVPSRKVYFVNVKIFICWSCACVSWCTRWNGISTSRALQPRVHSCLIFMRPVFAKARFLRSLFFLTFSGPRWIETATGWQPVQGVRDAWKGQQSVSDLRRSGSAVRGWNVLYSAEHLHGLNLCLFFFLPFKKKKKISITVWSWNTLRNSRTRQKLWQVTAEL